jgi:hypothetical protein
MIIQSSNVGMNSRHVYKKTEASITSLNVWGGVKNENSTNGVVITSRDGEPEQKNDSSGNSFTSSMQDIYNRFQSSQRVSASPVSDLRSTIHKMQTETLSWLFRLFFGGKAKLMDQSENTEFVSQMQQEFGGHYESTYYYDETEYTNFKTTGTAVTADGREINFNVNLQMSRQFMEYSNTVIDFGAAQLTDPLVINLNNNVTQVSDQTFRFDIDADGTLDTISMLGPGSGYLALDKNGDGIINDGSELFGTTNGNGFADLAAYDSDGNGWIDEADEIFDKLRIWSKDASGKDVLVGLGAAGVGAIYLGSAETEFSLNSAKTNNTNAVIRQTGIFLYENGNVGTIQQMDVAKQFTASS